MLCSLLILFVVATLFRSAPGSLHSARSLTRPYRDGNEASRLRDPEESMTADQMIIHWSYPLESYDVVTEDGFVLSLLRIPHGRRGRGTNTTCHRPPILLVHGIFQDASAWVLNPPESSPGMILADAGFDVFLLSTRGTPLSQRHLRMQKGDREYWKFSIDDMAKYDAPAAIDKVLQMSGARELFWVGHSQGTLIGFLLLAEKPAYNKKIRALFQLGTVGTMHYVKGIARMVIKLASALQPMTNAVMLAPHEVGFYNPAVMGDAARRLCPPNKDGKLCYNLISHYTGPPSKGFNWTRAPTYFSNCLLATSSWTILQYIQNSNNNSMNHFDISPSENLRRYGSVHAPPYKYINIDSDVYLFWSRNDWMTTPREITKWLKPNLKKGVIKGAFEIPDYCHADWIFATDMKEKVYDRIISIVRKYESNACHE